MHLLEERLWRRLEALAGATIDQYAGNSGSYPLTVGLIDDSDAPNASNFNVSPQGLADRTNFLVARVGLAGVQWGAKFPWVDLSGEAQSVTNMCAASWTPVSQWLVAVGNLFGGGSSDTISVYSTAGLDPESDATAWPRVGSGVAFTGTACCARAVSIDPDGAGYWCAVSAPSVPNIQIQFVANASSAWGNKRTVAGGGDCAMVTFGGYLIYLTDQGTISSSANHGSAWSDFSTGVATPTPRAVQNGFVVCFASGHSVWSSTDGHTWSTAALSFGTGHSIVGIAWDATRSLFVLMTAHFSAPFTSEIWTSPDGVTWTELGFGATGQIPADFAILQGDWIATLIDASSGGPSGQIYSCDGGGHWYLSRAGFPSNSTSTSLGSESRLASSDQQLLTFNTYWGRFSALHGLPLLHL